MLDKMCFGDPGETMRGMRHSLEAAVSYEWTRLTAICVMRCSSERAGTRYWAVDELGVLRDPAALPMVLRMFEDRELEVAGCAVRAAARIVEREPRLRPQVMAALREIGRRREELREDVERGVRDMRCAAPAFGKIDDARLEAELVRTIRAHRDGAGAEGPLSSVFTWLLSSCLARCEEWDGYAGEPDGLLGFSTAMTSDTTIEVRGQMTSFGGRGQCLEPFEARITIDETQDVIRSGEIKYGDARVGLGATQLGEDGTRPENVTAWLYVFVK